MTLKHLFLSLVTLLTLQPFANANFKIIGTVTFTEEEKTLHKSKVAEMSEIAYSCMNRDLQLVRSFHAKYGFAPFYGDNGKLVKLTEAQRFVQIAREIGSSVDFVKNAVERGLESRPGARDGRLRNMSCVGIVMKCLSEGFRATDQATIWKKVRDLTVANGSDGTVLQHALRELGWKVYYWNPDMNRSEAWDREEQQRYPNNNGIRGWHASRLAQIRRTQVYYKTKVDDARTLTQFGSTTPDYLRSLPLFVGTAHSGYHVFAGRRGVVIEGHAGYSHLSPNIVESAPFNPLAKNGAPSGQMYRSGLIAVPPL